jgi:branched-chain amino acid aminotransferase
MDRSQMEVAPRPAAAPFSTTTAVDRMIVCMNGEFVDAADAKVSVFDHGLLYGDGVFDTIAGVRGRIFWLSEHVDRLLDGCSRIDLTLPWSKRELMEMTEAVFRKNGGDSGRIRITITRGAGEVPLTALHTCRPTLIIFSTPLEQYPSELYTKGLRLAIAPYGRIYPRVKSLSFLASVLGYLTAESSECDEAVFVDHDGNLLEGSTFNVFVVKDGRIVTPRENMLQGVTRDKVVEMARAMGLPVDETTVRLADAQHADEMFATGTTKKIVPVTQIGEHVIASRQVGRVTSALMKRFAELYF